jgi:NAD(P)H dehydrogenase (quinone)
MIVVTGATGGYGHAVVEHLLARGVAPQEIVVAVRTPTTAAELRERGVVAREADYDRPETLTTAFAGADRLLFVSANGPNAIRIVQHRAVVDAAERAGVGLVAYTSLINADRNPLQLAEVHRDTEQALADSGLPTVLLRNGWYTENYTGTLQHSVDQGVIVGSAGDARIASASREDLAEAAAVVLTQEDPAGAVHELSGDTAWTLPDLAETVQGLIGQKPVVYRNLPPDEYRRVLAQAGMPEFMVENIVDADIKASQGALATTTKDLRRLLGRPTKTMAESAAEAVQLRT